MGAFLVRLPLSAFLGDRIPYITFFLATAISASYGGWGPGLLTTFLGAALVAFFFLPPLGSFIIGDMTGYWGMALFVLVSSCISYLAGRLMDASRQERALRLLFQLTLVSIGDGVIATDKNKEIRFMNLMAERLTGWSENEAQGVPIEEVFRIVGEGSDIPSEVPVDRIIKTGKIHGLANHTELIQKGGERIAIEDSGAPILDDEGRVAGAVIVFRDVTAKRRAERELEAAERQSRTILESITDAFVLLDREWRYVKMNPSAEKILRAPAASLIGRSQWEAYPGMLGTPVETFYRGAMAGGPSHFENYYEPWDQWFAISAYPSDEGLAIYFRDITERKRSEAKVLRLNEDLKQFTAAATHDVREPLRMITVFVQMLQRRMGTQLDEETLGYMTHVTNGAQRISRLLDGLLQFTRMGEIEATKLSPVDANASLKETLDDLQLAISEVNATVIAAPLPQVMADSAHLSQVFQNLIGNALKYRNADTPPLIHISAQKNGAQWTFAVADNGIGIAKEYHAQIFIPFQRLHGSEIAGAGIGLATCKRIIERYGGRLWVESAEGQGSTFYFSLPAAPSSETRVEVNT